MSIPLGQQTYQQKARREAFEALGASISKGASQMGQQQILDEILQTTDPGSQDFITAILQSRLPPDRQRALIQDTGQYQERQRKGIEQQQTAQLKQQEQMLKRQQDAADIEAINVERRQHGLPPLPESVSPATARSLTGEPTFEKTSEQEKGKFLWRDYEAKKKEADFAKKASRSTKRIADLSAGGGAFDVAKSLVRYAGYSIPPNASEAEIQTLGTDLWQGLREGVGSIRFRSEFDTYLNTLPSIQQLPQVREALASNMQKGFELTAKKQDIRDELVVENGSPYLGMESDVDRIFEERYGQEADEVGLTLDTIIMEKRLPTPYDLAQQELRKRQQQRGIR